MRRWFRNASLDDYVNADHQPVTLVCGYCRHKADPATIRFDPLFYDYDPRKEWQYRTTSLHRLIKHHEDEHIENFLSVGAVLRQTSMWALEQGLRQGVLSIWNAVRSSRMHYRPNFNVTS